MGIIKKLFGTRSQREIKKIQPLVDKILSMEAEYAALSDEALKGKTAEFKTVWPRGRPWMICCPRPLPPFGRPHGVCWA